jgi:hypothetical protein
LLLGVQPSFLERCLLNTFMKTYTIEPTLSDEERAAMHRKIQRVLKRMLSRLEKLNSRS